MAYHKVYMNQIFSTSLTGQLAFMWRKELLCDAVIKAGNFSTKAHRLVMIAACPMLQHMENASLGSHLEVRLSSDISVTSIKMFLQYLYEGFMKLTEENYKEIEKISKVLQVDSITKCCIDFAKCLRQQSDQHYPDVNEFGIQEQAEFKFVKATDLEKTFSSADNTGDFGSSNKRPRVQSGRRESTGLDYPSRNYQEDRRAGFGSSSQNQQSTHSEPIEILDDGVEVINSEPAQRDEEGWPVPSSQPPLQHSMGVGVSTQSGTQPDVRVISISDHDVSIPVSTPPISQTSQPQETPQHTGFTSHASTKVTEQLGTIQPMTGIDVPVQQRVSQSSPFTTSTQCQLVPVPANQRKPFAAGNESQLNVSKDVDPSVYTGGNYHGVPESNLVDTSDTSGLTQVPTTSDGRNESSYMEHDQGFQDSEISIIKVEHLSGGESIEMGLEEGRPPDQSEMIYVQKAPSSDNEGEEYSNEASNMIEGASGIQNTSLQQDIKGRARYFTRGAHKEAGFYGPERTRAYAQSGHQALQGQICDISIMPLIRSAMDRSGPERCKYCSATFNGIENLIQHFREAHDKNFIEYCTICQKGFKSKSGYYIHKKMNHSAKCHFPRCKLCGRQFASQSRLSVHLKTHTREKSMRCPHCSVTFGESTSLMQHILQMHQQ